MTWVIFLENQKWTWEEPIYLAIILIKLASKLALNLGSGLFSISEINIS